MVSDRITTIPRHQRVILPHKPYHPTHPKTRDLPSGSFIYDLHGISQLGQDLLIRQRRHIRMRPGMNSDVTALIERVLEVWFVPVNVTANHEVGRGDVVFGEVRV